MEGRWRHASLKPTIVLGRFVPADCLLHVSLFLVSGWTDFFVVRFLLFSTFVSCFAECLPNFLLACVHASVHVYLFMQVEAIRNGLASVVPIEHLRLFSWDELEVFVCGRKDVDIDLLEACTEYTLCSRQDSHVAAFWDVLRSFSPKEKSLFLR